MDVTFETTQGRRFTVEIWYFATVRAMKEYVRKHAGIPVESQRLFFQGRELEDDRDADHYSILQGSHVLIVLPDDSANGGGGNGNGGGATAVDAGSGAAAAPPAVVVHVVASAPAAAAVGGGTVAVDVDASCTVARLKEILQERTDGALPAAKVSVSFEKAEMEDGKALAEYFNPPPAEGATMEVCVAVRQPPPPPPPAACNGAALAVAVAATPKTKQPPPPQQQQQSQPPQQRMSVEVKWGARTATLEVSDAAAVRELRAELGSAAAHLLLPDDGGYFFIYKQNVMEEDRTLRWHDVKNGDTIEIFNGRVTGGA